MSALSKLSKVWMWKGISGSSRGWLMLGAATHVLHWAGKLIGNQPQLVYREQLEPGQTLIIRHFRRDEN